MGLLVGGPEKNTASLPCVLTKDEQLQPNHEQTSDKPKLRDTLQNDFAGPLKVFEVMKNEERVGKGL